MTKFSNFIRNPGTAGPPTVEGIYALGFALRSEIVTLLGKFVRVDQAQTFTAPEKAQARANIGAVIGTDVQAYSPALSSIAGLTTAADNLPYTTASNTYAVTTLTAFARTILDDTNAAGVRTTIGLGNVDNTSDANKPVSTAQQAALDLKAPLASPALTGTPTAPTATVGTNTTQIATTAFVLANAAAVTKVFTSTAQTITAAGLLTIPHGLGAVPNFVTAELQCVSNDAGYVAGDRLEVGASATNFSTNSNGHTIRKDATNLYVRFGSTGGVYVILNGSGVITTITAASWRLVVRAYV